MSEWDAPNQQVVRADQSHPADEGTGGDPAGAAGDEFDSMTKNELLAEAEARDLDVSAQMNKDDLKAALRGS